MHTRSSGKCYTWIPGKLQYFAKIFNSWAFFYEREKKNKKHEIFK